MPAEAVFQVSASTISEAVQEALSQLFILTVVVREEKKEVHFVDYWGNTHALVKVCTENGFLSASMKDDFDPSPILLDHYGTQEDVIQEALVTWLHNVRNSQPLPPVPTVWDLINEA